MAGGSQLGIYNKALRHLEERKLLSLTEPREPRRYLDDEWGDAILFVLSQGYWKHAVRLQKIDASATNIPQFGFEYAFPKPADWISTFQIADNEGFEPLMRRYDDANNFWYSDITPIYAKFISSDPSYGLDMSLWTPGFSEYLAIYLAWLCAPRLKQSTEKVEVIEKRMKMIRIESLAKDAMDLPTGKIPYGTWVQSRAPRGSILPVGNPFGGIED